MGINPHSNCLDFSLYAFSVFWVAFIAAVSNRVRSSAEVITVVVFIFY